MQKHNVHNSDEPNTYIEELKKCINKEVVVIDTEGREYTGICKAISFVHLNIILMSSQEKIIIKNISNIKRKRSYTSVPLFLDSNDETKQETKTEPNTKKLGRPKKA